MSHTTRLRELLAGQPFIAPGCYDAFTALLIEQAGFGCAYVSGASIAFTRLGRPDIGLTTLTEVAETVGNIRDRFELGYVIDYADLHIGSFRPFLIFNIADAAITIGVVIILARSLFVRDKEATETGDTPRGETDNA